MIVSLFILSFLGLGISAHLLSKKLKNEKIVCFLGQDCDNVVKSKYSKTLGIPNEVPGILFYLVVFGGVLLLSQGKEMIVDLRVISLLRISAVLASLASFYLISIQVFKLKMWCEYCIASAIINGLILILVFL
ncbi:MAG: Uncharacterized protein Greene071421_27 [Parcubacteria group bacterium Greene0714_21]|nr:MAG: Uncharacterized protein Greene041639_425 [Parcubacteria group bacterium Greene0416_39]TSC97942.1 MAG: Uncharacterized protein Greene101447_240 [Parcubacteria group bacterium Greene1014_47]TSD04541.1 MAG: Uncharacterized protein Greene071421_27 [Parcubacteria group bacterium Greene0714_21]